VAKKSLREMAIMYSALRIAATDGEGKTI